MKIRKIILLWTIISLSICMIAQEQKYTVKQVTEYLQHNYEAINDAVIHFEKHIKLGFAKIEQDFHGTLTMKKPNYFMVESEYEKFVTDGKTVWAYSAVNNQVIIDNYKENNNSISLEKFMLNLPENYYVSLIGYEETQSGNIIQLKLVPKDDRSFLKSVKLSIEEISWMIHKIVILDINETETTYIIKDIISNTDISEKNFMFETPPGAEVVDIR